MKKKVKTKSSFKKWPKDESLVEVEKGKCLIVKPTWPYNRENLDESWGLIAVILCNGISTTKDAYIRPSTTVYENDKNPEELVFEFDKKYTKRIKKIEEDYNEGRGKICPIDMCSALLSIITYSGVTNPKSLVSNYKSRNRNK